MVQKALVSGAVGVLTGVVVALIGVVLKDFGLGNAGDFIVGVAVIVGVAAGVVHYFTGRTLA